MQRVAKAVEVVNGKSPMGKPFAKPNDCPMRPIILFEWIRIAQWQAYQLDN
jgi:hypothetical protein